MLTFGRGRLAFRPGIGNLKSDVVKDTAMLNALKTNFEDAHKNAAGNLSSAGTAMVQRIDQLCDSLKHYSIQATQLESRVENGAANAVVQTLTDQVAGLTKQLQAKELALSSHAEGADKLTRRIADLQSDGATLRATFSSLEAQLVEAKEAVSQRSEWYPRTDASLASGAAVMASRGIAVRPAADRVVRLMQSIASDLLQIEPTEVGPLKPGSPRLYYKLSALRTAQATRRASIVVDIGQQNGALRGRCPRHIHCECLRVMLRREEGGVKTLFTKRLQASTTNSG
ncbi:hypothetical protein MFIFM68171_02565 [Madurella fahalii]|uniref:Uncharacterized protein n=1 Tax=Madurella fahalii TaxID=1157608 RepID=A0ABQ0G3N5_9PEZI